MMQLVFATNNRHKLEELRMIAGATCAILSADEAGCMGEMPETADDLAGNALQKVHYVYDRLRCDCFADDTGLEVAALGGKPGVLSARYAGSDKNPVDNMHKLLAEMSGLDNRQACFRTVIALIYHGCEHLFEGRIDGRIIDAPHGRGGFGYDPIFVPNGYVNTFAELPPNVKNNISHRKIAVDKLLQFLQLQT